MSIYRVSVLNIWRSTNEAEKRKVMNQFIKKHGEHYTQDEFLDYLEKKYRSRVTPYTLPINSRRHEH